MARRSPLGQTVLLFLCVGGILLGCRRCSSTSSAPETAAADAAVATATPSSEAPQAAEDEPRAPAPRRTGAELVKAAIGRWETPDGKLEVAVDPPHPATGKRPAYHLVVTRAGAIPFGCDFSDPERVRVPGLDAIENYELTFRAWCGSTPRGGARDRGSFIALTLEDGALRFALTVGGEKKVTSGPLIRRATH